MSAFLQGGVLSRRFYEEAVRPLLAEYFAGIPYAAAHLGTGSDVLGFDTEMSQDHDWGPAVHIFLRAQVSATWQEREEALCEAYELLASMHNALGITHKMPETASPFFSRPFNVIHGDDFANALIEQITDNDVRRIASKRLIGSIDQFSDNTDLRCVTEFRPVLRRLYE